MKEDELPGGASSMGEFEATSEDFFDTGRPQPAPIVTRTL